MPTISLSGRKVVRFSDLKAQEKIGVYSKLNSHYDLLFLCIITTSIFDIYDVNLYKMEIITLAELKLEIMTGGKIHESLKVI